MNRRSLLRLAPAILAAAPLALVGRAAPAVKEAVPRIYQFKWADGRDLRILSTDHDSAVAIAMAIARERRWAWEGIRFKVAP